MEIDNIYNMDCLEGMKQIPDGTIDAVICDLPYGTMKGIVNAPGWGNCSCEWDEIIPTDKLFAEYERGVRRGGAIVLFSQEPYTSHLRTFKAYNAMKFCYPMMWKKDSAGKPLAVGDKVVTCMIFKDNPDITMYDLNKQNAGGADVYGLLPDDDKHLNGWFADYILVRGGSTIFNVSDLDLDSRILIEPCAVLIHADKRAKTKRP